MAYKVIYKKRFNNKLIKLLQYLEKEWGQKVSNDFLDKVDKRIQTLKQQPLIRKPSAKKPEVRAISIIALNLYDTRKNSKYNPFD